MVGNVHEEAIASCKVTYFIGKMLAKAGTLILNKNGLMFVPTALDRAMGAIDIPIPLQEIEGFYYNDSFQKNLQIKTPARMHRFIGNSLNEIHEYLITLKRKQGEETKMNPPPETPAQHTKTLDTCFNCSKPIKNDFKFCPYCRSQLKLLCHQCKEPIEETWLSCPYCNAELKKS